MGVKRATGDQPGKLTGIDDPQLAEIVRRLAEVLRPERIYLFGSHARGEATPNSDYDIVIVVRKPALKPYSYERTAYRALLGLGISVDIVVMTQDFFDRRRGVTASLPATVEREGKLLYAA